MRKCLTATCLTLLTAFLLSCSNGGDDPIDGNENGSISITKFYDLEDVTDSSFTYMKKNEYYLCKQTGLEYKESFYDEEAQYSINNNVLTIKLNKSDSAEEYDFNGNSNVLTGTWTRNANEAPNCQRHCIVEEDGSGAYCYSVCEIYYNVTKLEFTPTTLAMTQDVCEAKKYDGQEYRGWAMKVTDCNTFEYSKRGQKITVKLSISENVMEEISTYNGNACIRTYKEDILHSSSERENACQKAVVKCQQKGDNWDSCFNDYYLEFLRGQDTFEECLKNNRFPDEFYL